VKSDFHKRVTIFIICFFIVGKSVNAQDYKSTICINGGESLVRDLFQSINTVSGSSISTFSFPAIQLSYEYSVVNWFSVGLALSSQNLGLNINNWLESANGITYNWQINVNRFNYALRALFHYGKFKRIDMYSGLRIGFTHWTISTSGSLDPYFNVTSILVYSGYAVFAPQIILYGIRFYITDHIGLNTELCFGSPYYWSYGLNYRL